MFSGSAKHLFEKAAELRRQQTFAEEILWNYLRTKPLCFKFRRQHPYSKYILDFYCHFLKLAIEVDGSIHKVKEIEQKDEIRQQQLEKVGLTFLRFINNQIRLRPEKVIEEIESYLKEKLEKGKGSCT